MVAQNFQDCPTHAGQRNARNRAGLDPVMSNLPANQAGAGRHKCPYCAYGVGYSNGYAAALKDAKAVISELDRDQPTA